MNYACISWLIAQITCSVCFLRRLSLYTNKLVDESSYRFLRIVELHVVLKFDFVRY